MQPYSQPLFWAALNLPNDIKYWFNGLPYEGIKRGLAPTGGEKYWFGGLPIQTVFR